MGTFKTPDNQEVTVRSGKCYKGLPLNRMNDQELQAVGYERIVVTAPVYEPTVADHIEQLDLACRAAIDSLHWSAGPMIFDKAKENKPKSKALKEWAEGCWVQFYTNSAILEAGGQWDDAMLVYPEKPFTAKEAMEE